MRYRALACDYDGTLATEGRVPAFVIAALEDLRRSGRTLLLVTGRTQDDLLAHFPASGLFSRVVLENGAVLFHPETGIAEALAPRPPDAFVRRLKERGVSPLSAGRVIVATREPHERAVVETIGELGLDLHLEFNKGAVMALPSGVNKATGLDAALRRIGLPWPQVVGVGDAENDRPFLERCGCAVAVANALPPMREKADWATRSPEGAGVAELVRELLTDDLAAADRGEVHSPESRVQSPDPPAAPPGGEDGGLPTRDSRPGTSDSAPPRRGKKEMSS